MKRTHTPSFVFASATLILVTSAGLALSTSATNAQSTTVQPEQVGRTISDFEIIMPQRFDRRAQVTQISSVDVDVRLTDALATTQMQITVENHGSSITQARLVLPVPEGSTIRTFGIDGIGDEPTAQLLPRKEATQRYHDIVRSMTDPGLLEFVGSALIQSSVFPVAPGEKRTMTIVYEQTLSAHKGRVEYVLPRSASFADSSIQWSIDVELESTGVMGPVFSPSHPIVSKIVNDHSMRVGVPMMNEPGPFRLYAMLGSADDATCMLYPDPKNAGSGYFMFVADAPEIDKTQEQIRREMTIVIDRSGSMGGQKIEQARKSATQIVNGMRKGEFVHIIDYSDDVRSFSDGPIELTGESIPQIIEYINNIQSRGGTNLHGALLESLRVPKIDNTLSMVLFLTDGLASVGERNEAQIRKDAALHNTQHKRVFTFGVGFDVNAPLLDGIAHDTKGESTFVLPNEDVEMKVGQVFDKLDGPVMIDPEFIASYGVYAVMPKVDLRLIEPSSIGDLFSGSRVVVLGQYHNLEDAPTYVGLYPHERTDGVKAISTEFVVKDASPKYSFVARLWAQERIKSLISQIRLASADGSQPNQELVDEIVKLSLEHGVMSEYTAFLADESMALELANAPQTKTQLNFSMDRAYQVRSGQSAVASSVNQRDADADQAQAVVAKQESENKDYQYSGGKVQSTGSITSNQYLTAKMDRVTVQTVQRSTNGTLYRKSTRWVDAQLGVNADAEPELTIEFDTDAYWELVSDLVEQGRQWILANKGEIYLVNHDQRVLVKNPD